MGTSKFVKEIEKLQPLQVDLGEVVLDVLREWLGETFARFTVNYLGEAMHDPNRLARGMTELLGSAASMMLDRIVSKCKASKPPHSASRSRRKVQEVPKSYPHEKDGLFGRRG